MTDVLEGRDAADQAVADIPDGATVLIGGFGPAGQPLELIDALARHGAQDLTVVNNNAGNGDYGLAALLKTGHVRKMICSFPQAERLVGLRRPLPLRPDRARGGAAGQPRRADACRRCRHRRVLHADQRRHTAGRGQGGTHDRRSSDYVLEYPLHGDYALIKAHRSDRMGNLVYRKTARNFGPVMATAASTTIAQVDDVVATGELDPEVIVTPSIYVDKVVLTA